MALVLFVRALPAAHAVRAHGDGEPPRPATAVHGEPERELHRALGLLQYVDGDYETAVSDDGVILDPDEFVEQHRILDEVASILRAAAQVEFPTHRSGVDLVDAELERVRDAAAERRPSAAVRAAIRRLRTAIVATYALHLGPDRPPRRQRGQALYRQSCSICHGSDGRGRTALALTLTQPPPDFRAARWRETLSPYQVFNVVTFGIPGTAMPAFSGLDADERWDLAFHVTALRHEPAPADRTGAKTAAVAAEPRPSLSELAGLTDAELGDWFVARGVSTADRDAAVARARRLQLHPDGRDSP